MSLSRNVTGREFQRHGPAATEKLVPFKTLSHTWLNWSYQLSHVWDKLLHTDDQHRQSVLMKAFDVKSKR